MTTDKDRAAFEALLNELDLLRSDPDSQLSDGAKRSISRAEKIIAAVEHDRQRQLDWHKIADERAAEIVRLDGLLEQRQRGEPVAYLRRDQIAQIRRRGPMVGEIGIEPRQDMVAVYAAPQPAGPVKMPSDQQILQLMLGFGTHVHGDTTATFTGAELLDGCRELLARYGAPQPPFSPPVADDREEFESASSRYGFSLERSYRDYGLTDFYTDDATEKAFQIWRQARAALARRHAEPAMPSDEEIDAVFNGMPDGLDGWLKTWGYRQFARAILDRYGNAAQPATSDEPTTDSLFNGKQVLP